ncbi:hypothetical protein ACFLTA_08595 [Bacteroidota bacterium]
MNKHNIYIEMLRFGSQNMEEGVTYNEVKDHLQQNGFTINEKNENPLYLWFFSSFFHESATHFTERVLRGESDFNFIESSLPKWSDDKVFLMGHAYMEYMDYVELKEARESAKSARTIAIWAIGISGFLALAAVSIQLYQIFCI